MNNDRMAGRNKSGIASGIALLEEVEGQGPPAARGDRVLFHWRIWLNRGDEVPINAIQAQQVPEQMVRTVAGEKLVDHTVTLGKREVIVGIEQSLLGMRAGGYRKVRVSPHLAYREKGIPGVIPENAVLEIAIWLREILPA